MARTPEAEGQREDGADPGGDTMLSPAVPPSWLQGPSRAGPTGQDRGGGSVLNWEALSTALLSRDSGTEAGKEPCPVLERPG